MPSHHPLNLNKTSLKGVKLFHFSWMNLRTEAVLLLKTLKVEDSDQHFILNEMKRYFEHDSVGVSDFNSMNSEWKDLNSAVRSNNPLKRNSKEVENTLISWHQESRDISLILSRELSVPVTLNLSRKHTSDPIARLKDDSDDLVKSLKLFCTVDIPNAASQLKITADLSRRTIECSMYIDVPLDKKKASAKLNWLLRQIKSESIGDVHIRVHTKGRSANPQALVSQVLENPNIVLHDDDNAIDPIGFDIFLCRDLAGKFSGRTTFVSCVEDSVLEFYKNIGQHLEAWVAPAPKITDKANSEKISKDENVKLFQQNDNEHTIKTEMKINNSN